MQDEPERPLWRYKFLAEFALALGALACWALDHFIKLPWAREGLLFFVATLLIFLFIGRTRS